MHSSFSLTVALYKWSRTAGDVCATLKHRSHFTIVLEVTTRRCEPDITVIELKGRVTLGPGSSHVDRTVLQAIESGVRRIVIDLSGVTYIDSTGIGIVAACFSRISKAGGQALVAGARGIVMDVFRVTRLDSIIKFFPDVQAACDSLGAARQSV